LCANCELSDPTASGECAAGLEWLYQDFEHFGETVWFAQARCAVVNSALMEYLV